MRDLILSPDTRVRFCDLQVARILSILMLMSWLSACIDPTVSVRRTGSSAVRIDAARTNVVQADQHRVEKGDTLYGIAFRYQLDVRELVQINQIYDPYIIYPGQMLRLKPENAGNLAAQTAPIRPVPAPQYSSSQAGSALTTSVNTAPVTGTSTQPLAGNSGGSITLPPTVVPASEGFVSVEPSASGAASAAGMATSGQTAPVSNPNSTTNVTVPPTATIAPSIPAPTIAVIPDALPAAPVLGVASGAPKPGANGWAWPTEGRLLSTFAASDAGRQGIDIRGNLGQPVYAARAGTVVYSGRGIRGYGELIVIKHDENTLSAYGHNQTRSAKEGQVVKQGALIAEMGKDPQGKELLHFEVRKNGKPVDPLGVLPKK